MYANINAYTQSLEAPEVAVMRRKVSLLAAPNPGVFLRDLVAILVAVFSCTSASGQSDAGIKVILFESELALPLYIAVDQGFFADRGLHVTLTPTGSSAELMTGLIAGEYQFAQAAIDNFIAYQEGQLSVPIEVQPDLVVLMGIASVDLPLVSKPEITNFAGLVSAKIGVDAPTTGYAFLLLEMLKKGGLEQDEFALAAIGGTRWAAMEKGEIDASLLNTVEATQARALGYQTIATSLEVVGPYQGSVIGANRSWVLAHRAETIQFVRAVLDGITALYDPRDRQISVESLRKRFERLSATAAEQIIEQLTSGATPLRKDGALDQEGLRTVMRLRNQYGTPRRDISDPGKYVDLSYHEAAQATPARLRN